MVRVEAADSPGDGVGDVDVRSVPVSALAICNLSAERLYVGIYVPLASGMGGEGAWGVAAGGERAGDAMQFLQLAGFRIGGCVGPLESAPRCRS